VWGIFGTLYTLFIVFSFSILRVTCFSYPFLMWQHSRGCLVKSTKNVITSLITSDSIHWSIRFNTSTKRNNRNKFWINNHVTPFYLHLMDEPCVGSLGKNCISCW
jgi:hypothetical protein